MKTSNIVLIVSGIVIVGGIGYLAYQQFSGSNTTGPARQPGTNPSSNPGQPGASTAAASKYPVGMLLKASDGKVYIIGADNLRHWVTGAAFARAGLSQSNVKIISDSEMSTIPVGSTLN